MSSSRRSSETKSRWRLSRQPSEKARIAELQDHVKELESRLRPSSQRIEQLETHIAVHVENEKALKEGAVAAQSQIDGLRLKNELMKDQVSEMKETVQAAEAGARESSNSFIAALQRIDELLQEKQRLEARLRAQAANETISRKSGIAVQVRIAELEDEVSQLKETVRAAEAEAEKSKLAFEQTEVLAREKLRLETRINAYVESEEIFKEDAITAQARINGLEDKLSDMKETIQAAEANARDSSRKSEAALERAEDLEQEKQQLTTRISAYIETQSALKEDIAAAQSRIVKLEDEISGMAEVARSKEASAGKLETTLAQMKKLVLEKRQLETRISGFVDTERSLKEDAAVAQSRIGELEDQVSKGEEAARLAEVSAVNLEAALSRTDSLSQEKQQLETSIRAYTENERSLREDAVAAHNRIIELERQASKMREEMLAVEVGAGKLEVAQKRTEELVQENKQLETCIAAHVECERTFKEGAVEAQSRINELELRVSKMEEAVSAAEARARGSSTDLRAALDRQRELDQEKLQLETRIGVYVENENALKEGVAVAQSQIDGMQRQTKIMKEQVSKMKDAVWAAEARARESSKKFEAALERTEELVQEKQELQSRIPRGSAPSLDKDDSSDHGSSASFLSLSSTASMLACAYLGAVAAVTITSKR